LLSNLCQNIISLPWTKHKQEGKNLILNKVSKDIKKNLKNSSICLQQDAKNKYGHRAIPRILTS